MWWGNIISVLLTSWIWQVLAHWWWQLNSNSTIKILVPLLYSTKLHLSSTSINASCLHHSSYRISICEYSATCCYMTVDNVVPIKFLWCMQTYYYSKMPTNVKPSLTRRVDVAQIFFKLRWVQIVHDVYYGFSQACWSQGALPSTKELPLPPFTFSCNHFSFCSCHIHVQEIQKQIYINLFFEMRLNSFFLCQQSYERLSHTHGKPHVSCSDSVDSSTYFSD